MGKNTIKNFIDYRKDIEKHFCETFGWNYKIYSVISAILTTVSFAVMIWYYVQIYKFGKEYKDARKSANVAYKYAKDTSDDEQIFEE